MTTFIDAKSNIDHAEIANTFQTIGNIANSQLIDNRTSFDGSIMPESKSGFGYVTKIEKDNSGKNLNVLTEIIAKEIQIMFVSLISKRTNVKRVFYFNGDVDAQKRPIVYFNSTSEVWREIQDLPTKTTPNKLAKIKAISGLIGSVTLEIIQRENGIVSRDATHSTPMPSLNADHDRIGITFIDRNKAQIPKLENVFVDNKQSETSLLAVLNGDDETAKKLHKAVLRFAELLPYSEPLTVKTGKSKQVYCSKLDNNETCKSYKFFPKVPEENYAEMLKEINELIACKKHKNAELVIDKPTKK